MDRNENQSAEPLDCGSCGNRLQEYLDGTLEKKSSLQVFLHLRDCDSCQQEHDQAVNLFQMLEGLPDLQPPADFDEKILASVNLEGYRAMESIRRQRVPIFLEEQFLPSWVRSRVTRFIGAGAAVVSLGAQMTLDSPGFLPVVVLAGLVPELLVRLQGIGRRVMTAQQSES